MKLKPLVALIACLAVLSAVVFWINRPAPPPPADPRVGASVLDPAVAARAARVSFSDQGKSIALTRQGDGTWTVDSYFGLPADFDKLTRFIGDLTDAKIQRLVTANPDRLARLEFKDTKIELLGDGGAVLWALDLGKNADPSGRFVRFGSESKAYLANLNTWLDTEPKNWASTQLLNLKPEDVAKVEIPFDAGGPVTVARASKDAPWTSDRTPGGQRVSADKISSLVSALGALKFSDAGDLNDPQASAAKAHERVFVLTLFDGSRVTAALGRKPEEKKLKPLSAQAPAPLPKSTDKSAPPVAPPAPEYDVTPAGPVYAFVSSSDAKAPVNGLMRRRAFQIDEFVFTALPQKAAELFEANPPPPRK